MLPVWIRARRLSSGKGIGTSTGESIAGRYPGGDMTRPALMLRNSLFRHSRLSAPPSASRTCPWASSCPSRPTVRCSTGSRTSTHWSPTGVSPLMAPSCSLPAHATDVLTEAFRRAVLKLLSASSRSTRSSARPASAPVEAPTETPIVTASPVPTSAGQLPDHLPRTGGKPPQQLPLVVGVIGLLLILHGLTTTSSGKYPT